MIAAVILAVEMTLGWLLTLFLPLTLFEGTLLCLLTTAFLAAFWDKVFDGARGFSPADDLDALDGATVIPDDDDMEEFIPETRFWILNSDRTWENWLRYLFANLIYKDFVETVSTLEEDEWETAAIALAGASVEAVKQKTSSVKNFRISRNGLKQAAVKLKILSYNNDVLDIAVMSVNDELPVLKSKLQRVKKDNLWKEMIDE